MKASSADPRTDEAGVTCHSILQNFMRVLQKSGSISLRVALPGSLTTWRVCLYRFRRTRCHWDGNVRATPHWVQMIISSSLQDVVNRAQEKFGNDVFAAHEFGQLLWVRGKPPIRLECGRIYKDLAALSEAHACCPAQRRVMWAAAAHRSLLLSMALLDLFRRAAEKKFALSLRELAEVTTARERQQQWEISSEVQTGCQVLLRDTFDAAKDMKGTGSHQCCKTLVATCSLSCLATPCSALRIEVTHVQSACRSMTTATLPVCCICLTISVCRQCMLSN